MIKYFLLLISLALIPLPASADLVDDVGQGISNAGESIGNAAEDLGASITGTEDDDLITANIEGRIAQLKKDNQIGSGSDLRVMTLDGVVTVSGYVENAEDITVVKQSVEDVDGVKSVNTKIDVKAN